MTVAKLQRYLDELLAEDRQFDAGVVATFKEIAQDWVMVSDDEYAFLAHQVLGRHGDRFADEAARRDLEDFLARAAKSRPTLLKRLLEIPAGLPGFFNIAGEVLRAQGAQLFGDGTDREYLQQAQSAANIHFRGTASLARIHPQTEEAAEIEDALKKAISAIGGFDFLSRPPQGKAQNEHTILIKVGVNWGEFQYPTVTSPESVYALTRICFAEADKRKASVKVIVGDESGIETKLWAGKTTMDNFEHAGIFQAAVRAGVERAAALEQIEPLKYAGAQGLLEQARTGSFTREAEHLIAMARQAGVRVVPFEDERETTVIPVPGARHFTDGILVPKMVAEEVTDILNLCKPPGRHLILGNSGLTGALKNHVGFLRGSQRSPGLHGPGDRYPMPLEGQTKEAYVETLRDHWQAIHEDKTGQAALKFALGVVSNWKPDSPPVVQFNEKIAELYLAVSHQERFSLTDMRRTIGSLGPDLGAPIDIGAVIAAKDPLTLDILAAALLKRAYEKMGGILDVLAPGAGGDLLEFLSGNTWLRGVTPFDLLSHTAATSYGLGPVDFAHIDLMGLDESGFEPEEIEAIKALLGGRP